MLAEELDELGVGGIRAVQPDPLVEPPQVRRRERADVDSPRANRCSRASRRTSPLPLVPATVTTLYGGGLSFESLEHRDHAIEREVDLLRMQRLEPREPAFEREVAPRRRSHCR